MHTAREKYGIASINGKIYVAGGSNTDSLECYDPISNTWSSKKPMIAVQQNVFEWSNKLYAIGYNKNLDQYDPEDDEWTTVRINSSMLRLRLLLFDNTFFEISNCRLDNWVLAMRLSRSPSCTMKFIL